MFKKTIVAAFVAGSALLAATPASAAEAGPAIFGSTIRLGIAECASDINDFGAVVTATRLWWLGRSAPLPAGIERATHINNKGQIAGSTSDKAVLWDGRTLNTIINPGDDYSYVAGLNEGGEVVGVSGVFGGAKHAFVWRKGVLTLLTGLSDDTAASGLNDRGEIVGTSTVDGRQVAVRWDKSGSLTELATLGGTGGNSLPTNINNSGVIVGYGNVAPDSGETRAVRWEKDGTVTDLNLSGSSFGIALDINDRGQIVGNAADPDPTRPSQQAFFVDRGKPMQLVAPGGDSAGGTFSAINEFGVSVGCDYVPESDQAILRVPKIR